MPGTSGVKQEMSMEVPEHLSKCFLYLHGIKVLIYLSGVKPIILVTVILCTVKIFQF